MTLAATGALLSNLEGVLTALMVWFVFRENFDRRIALDMAVIVAGGALLLWDVHIAAVRFSWGALLVVGACLGWAVDNNPTRKISAADPTQIAMWKGLAAGIVNLVVGFLIYHQHIALGWLAAAGVLGFFSYGASLEPVVNLR